MAVRKNKKKVGGKKARPKKRSPKRRMRGGALGDYIPSFSTAASYVPGYSYLPSAGTALGYVPGATTAMDYYNKGTKAYETGKKLYGAYEQYGPVLENLANFAAPPAPPPPPKQAEKMKIIAAMSKEELAERMKKAGIPFDAPNPQIPVYKPNPLVAGTSFQGAIDMGRKYQPISKIDGLLSRFGVRDKVRGFLDRNKLGFINSGADALMKIGFGKGQKMVRPMMARQRHNKAAAIKKSAVVVRGGNRMIVSKIFI